MILCFYSFILSIYSFIQPLKRLKLCQNIRIEESSSRIDMPLTQYLWTKSIGETFIGENQNIHSINNNNDCCWFTQEHSQFNSIRTQNLNGKKFILWYDKFK